MEKRSVPDRNRVAFGPVSVDTLNLQRDLDEVTYQTNRNREGLDEVAVQFETFEPVPAPAGPSAPVFYATINTYNPTTNDGSLTRTTTSEVLAYRNGTGDTLQTGDTVAVTEESDTGGYVVIAIIQRASPYTPASQEYARPTGFPIDGFTVGQGIQYITGSGFAEKAAVFAFDQDGALGLGNNTIVSVYQGSTSQNFRVLARCTATGLNYDLGWPSDFIGTTVTIGNLSNWPYIVRCGKYIVFFANLTVFTGTIRSRIYVWDNVNGWRSWFNGTTTGDYVNFVSQATIAGYDNYAIVTLAGATNSQYHVLDLDSMTSLSNGAVPRATAGSPARPLAISRKGFVWSSEGFTGTLAAGGTLTWSSSPLHTIAENDLLGAAAYWTSSIHPLTGEFYYVTDPAGTYLLVRCDFTTALSSNIVLWYDGVDPTTDPVSIFGLDAAADGNVVVAMMMNDAYYGWTSNAEWPIIISTDFDEYTILFEDGSAQLTDGSTTCYFTGVATDGTTKVTMFGQVVGTSNPGSSTYNPGANSEWCLIDGFS